MSEKSMIERVARELCERDGGDPEEVRAGEGFATGQSWLGWQAYAADALALIKAMRVSSFEMIIACGDLPGSQQEYWERSIDAAVVEGEILLAALARN